MNPTTRFSASTIMFLTLVFAGACSSSSSSSGNPVYCGLDTGETSGLACSCTKPDGTHSANSTACSETSIGVDSVCSQHADTSCQCDPFLCTQASATVPLVACSYAEAAKAFFPASSIVQPSACVGTHYCMSTTSYECVCQTDACDTTDVELTSCTDATARTKLAMAWQTFHSGTPVDDCRAALATASSGGGGGNDTNICPGGPGRCRNGDSSTCNCGTSCVQTATCVGCDYECVKGCAADADCKGFFSSNELGDGGSVSPQPLVCIGASSTMPTPHCGIGTSGG